MALPLERWAKQAVLLERKQDPTPVASKRVWDDVDDAQRLARLTWKQRERELVQDQQPVALEGVYAGLNAYPNVAVVTTTSLSGTVNLWPQALFTPIQANSILAPEAFRVMVTARITTVATPANIGFDPRMGQGTWTTGGTGITGITLGASTNVALTASITSAYYYIIGDLTMRTVGAPGANSTAMGLFHYVGTQATSGGLAGPAVVGAGHNLLFGHTSASYDSSVASGWGLGAVHTVTTITHNVEQIHWMSWN